MTQELADSTQPKVPERVFAEITMSEHNDAHEHAHHHHHHDCGNLFGCGDEKGTGIIREDIKDAAFDKRASDRLLHMSHHRLGRHHQLS
jgi:hypothetical protein